MSKVLGGISGSREPGPSVSALTGFDPGRIREALRRVFDNEVTFAFMAKGMSSGGYPLGEDGQRRWSDWLADQVEREMEML